MIGTKKDFLRIIDKSVNKKDIDSICFSWLRLICMDYEKKGEIAIQLLNIVQDMLSATD